eukprot:GHVS01058843.1.p1 GENE.GHVS01058843.1~~GHVS01058843.1.p1  ORF type:complete len:111 (-),score=2.07 GHVS01058843.1:151-483(-)
MCLTVSAKPDKAAVSKGWFNKSTNLHGNTETPAKSAGADAEILNGFEKAVAGLRGSRSQGSDSDNLGIDTGDDKAGSASSNEASDGHNDLDSVAPLEPSLGSDASKPGHD